jgi:hypothetical protein
MNLVKKEKNGKWYLDTPKGWKEISPQQAGGYKSSNKQIVRDNGKFISDYDRGKIVEIATNIGVNVNSKENIQKIINRVKSRSGGDFSILSKIRESVFFPEIPKIARDVKFSNFDLLFSNSKKLSLKSNDSFISFSDELVELADEYGSDFEIIEIEYITDEKNDVFTFDFSVLSEDSQKQIQKLFRYGLSSFGL